MSQFQKEQEEGRPLGSMRVGERARIRAVQVAETIGQRLLALGMLPGTDVAMIQVAPLGDPIAVEFQGRRVSLRRKEALGITIEPIR